MKNGKIIDSDGTIKWYKDDELHCEDGPAYENHEMRIKAWFLNGIQYNEEDFNQWIERKKFNEKLEKNLKEKPVSKKKKI